MVQVTCYSSSIITRPLVHATWHATCHLDTCNIKMGGYVCGGNAIRLGGALNNPLTSSVTPFSALHSSARNHATLFSMFFSSSKNTEEHSIVLQCQCSGSMFCIAGTGVEPMTSPAGNVVLITGILFFLFIANIKSKRDFFFKPCGRTTQFYAGLHCQSESSAGQSSLGRV